MALQLQIYVDLRPNSFHLRVTPQRGRKKIAQAIGVRSGLEGDGEKRSPSVRRVALTNAADSRISFTEKGRSSVTAAPSSSRVIRRGIRRHETNVQGGDRIMYIIEWVHKKVKDPMVEIDPVTVEKRIKAEEVQEEVDIEQEEERKPEGNTIATITPAVTSFQPSLGFSRVSLSTKAAGVVLLLAALVLAFLTFRSKSVPPNKSKRTSHQFSVSPAPAGIGSKKDTGSSRVIRHSLFSRENASMQELHARFQSADDDAEAGGKPVTLRAFVALDSWQSQAEERHQVPSSPVVKLRETRKEDKILEQKAAVPFGSPADSELPFFNEKVAVGVDRESSRPEVGVPDLVKEQSAVLSVIGFENSTSEIADLRADDKAFDQLGVSDATEFSRVPVEVADIEEETKPFEQWVVSDATGLAGDPPRISDLGTDSKPLEQVLDLRDHESSSTPGGAAPDSETQAVQFQNALMFDRPQEAEKLLPEEYESQKVSLDSERSNDLVDTSSPQLSEFDMELKSPEEPLGEDGSDDSISTGGLAAIAEMKPEDGKRKSYGQAIQAVVPAIAVGAGALSTLSGVTSALEMVGFVAAASFLAREMVMASAREQLLCDLSKIKDRKSFLDFLKSREIVKGNQPGERK